ncbi:hypothetical protein ACYUJ6_13845 [Clostridium sp. JNZ X4-2]
MAGLCFDYGHGGSDSGACYKGREENAEVQLKRNLRHLALML